MRRKLILIAAVAFLAVAAWRLQPAQKTPLTTLPCVDIVQGCGNRHLQIHFNQIPQAMQPFRLQINTANALKVKQVHASFTMQGMDMGLNRYRLTPQTNDIRDYGIWIANVTLPVCMQGRGNWVMTLEMDTAMGKEQYQLTFTSRLTMHDSSKQ